MSNQPGPQNSAHALSTLSSFEGLKTSYSVREPYAVRDRVAPVVKMNPRTRQQLQVKRSGRIGSRARGLVGHDPG
jgi:hypothetical protein